MAKKMVFRGCRKVDYGLLRLLLLGNPGWQRLDRVVTADFA